MEKQKKSPIKIQFIKGAPIEHYAGALQIAKNLPDYPYEIQVQSPAIRTKQELLQNLEKAKTLDAIVITENVLSLNGSDGYNALEEAGFAKLGQHSDLPPVLLVTSNHLDYNKVGFGFSSDFNLRRSNLMGKRIYRRVCDITEKDVNEYGFVPDETAPMLKYADAIVARGRVTYGDFLEILKRAVARDYLGSGLFCSNDKVINSGIKTGHPLTRIDYLSSFWQEMQPETESYRQLKNLGTPPRHLRYSKDVRPYVTYFQNIFRPIS